MDYFEKISWDPAGRLPWHHVVLVEGSGDQFTNLAFPNFDNVLIGFYSADSLARYSVLWKGSTRDEKLKFSRIIDNSRTVTSFNATDDNSTAGVVGEAADDDDEDEVPCG